MFRGMQYRSTCNPIPSSRTVQHLCSSFLCQHFCSFLLFLMLRCSPRFLGCNRRASVASFPLNCLGSTIIGSTGSGRKETRLLRDRHRVRSQARPWVASFMQLGSSRRTVISIMLLRSIGLPGTRSLCVTVMWNKPNFTASRSRTVATACRDPSLPMQFPRYSNKHEKNVLFHVRHEFANTADPEGVEGLRRPGFLALSYIHFQISQGPRA
ncbi:hypothetical protein B0T20DRAFT_152766 [Sordaria brevicollis]|uniref:Uncharacterized protein n=1 Tax=Sordaria brevicollis TaxID=83679 RepID=A0AAE0UES6_SORBR|nr:hypothetical protein B0T20DRAFT_152766 [Sordaria brevicollis]